MNKLIYAEFILRILPFVKLKGGEKISEKLGTTVEENNNVLDLVAVPAAAVDSDDRIIYVNHMWMSLYDHSQSVFIGNKFIQFAGHDPDGELFTGEKVMTTREIRETESYMNFFHNPHSDDNERHAHHHQYHNLQKEATDTPLRIFMINRTKRMEELRANTKNLLMEHDRIAESTQPLLSLSKEELNKEVICLTISIIPFEIGTEDIDKVRSYMNELIKLFDIKMKESQGNKLFLWNGYEISIVFGFHSTELTLPALYAMELASVAIQFAKEHEEIYEFFVSCCLMKGTIGGKMDGFDCKMNRALNSISLSKSVADLLSSFIYDLVSLDDNGVVVVVLDSDERIVSPNYEDEFPE